MSEDRNNENGFVGYEYKDVTVSRLLEPICTDGYESFGWKLENSGVSLDPTSVTLKFKRDRKLRNRAELARLQRQFDTCANEVLTLERSKATTASVVAYIVGIVGAAFMTGAVFSYLASMIPLMIILAIPGFAGFILPYFLFARVRKTKTGQVTPLIDSKYDEMYSVCEKASALLGNA